MKLSTFEQSRLRFKLRKPLEAEITQEEAKKEFDGFVKLAAETNLALMHSPVGDPAFGFLHYNFAEQSTIVALLGRMLHENTDNWAFQITAREKDHRNLIRDLQEVFPCSGGLMHGHSTFLLKFKPEHQEEVKEFLKAYRVAYSHVPPEYFDAIVESQV